MAWSGDHATTAYAQSKAVGESTIFARFATAHPLTAAFVALVQRYDEGHRHKTDAGALSHSRDTGAGLDWLRSDFNDLSGQPTLRALFAGLVHASILPRRH